MDTKHIHSQIDLHFQQWTNSQIIILLIIHKPGDQCLNGNKFNNVWVNAMVTGTLSIPTYRKKKYNVNTLRKI